MRALYKPQFFYHFIRNRTPNPSDNITLYELPQFEGISSCMQIVIHSIE